MKIIVMFGAGSGLATISCGGLRVLRESGCDRVSANPRGAGGGIHDSTRRCERTNSEEPTS